MVSLTRYFIGSLIVTLLTLANVYNTQQEFYSTVVQIAKNKGILVLLFNLAVVSFLVLCKLFVRVFFGELKQAQVQHTQSHGVHYVIDMIFACYFLGIELVGKVGSHFVLNAGSEAIHTLTTKRVQYVISKQMITQINSRTSYIRIFFLHLVLFYLDLLLLTYYFGESNQKFMIYLSYQVWIIQYLVLTLVLSKSLVVFVVNLLEMAFCSGEWTHKRSLIMYTELFFTLSRCFVVTVQYYHLSAITNLGYLAGYKLVREVSTAWKVIKKFAQARKLIKKLEVFPDATPQQIADTDDKCIFCLNKLNGAKKINCGHLFHQHCLRDYFLNATNLKCPMCNVPIDEQRTSERNQKRESDQIKVKVKNAILGEFQMLRIGKGQKLGAMPWGLPQEVVGNRLDRNTEKARREIFSMNQFLLRFYQHPPEEGSESQSRQEEKDEEVADENIQRLDRDYLRGLRAQFIREQQIMV